jgi:hypothetical protein
LRQRLKWFIISTIGPAIQASESSPARTMGIVRMCLAQRQLPLDFAEAQGP